MPDDIFRNKFNIADAAGQFKNALLCFGFGRIHEKVFGKKGLSWHNDGVWFCGVLQVYLFAQIRYTICHYILF